MDINKYLSNFKLPEYKEVTESDIDKEYSKLAISFPEMEKPEGSEKTQWLKEIAVERFVNSIIDKISSDTNINFHEL